MTNKDHCKATEVMLGLRPHPEIHQFIDGFYKSMGWGHRSKRHDYKIIDLMADLYGDEGGEAAGVEAAFHIVCDLKLVTEDDLKIWRGIISTDRPPPKGRTTVEVRGTKFKVRV